MCVGKDVYAFVPRDRNGHTRDRREDLRDESGSRWLAYIVRGLAERAILMRTAIRVRVNKLDRAAKQQKNGDKSDEYQADARIVLTNCGESSHP